MSNVTPLFTGYRFELEDNHRAETKAHSAAYSMLCRGEYQTTDLFKWWHIRNQGQVSSCRGHSGAANMRFLHRLSTGKLPDLDGDGIENEKLQDDFSAMYFYLMAQKFDNLWGRDQGATIGAGVKVAMAGCAREIKFPYPGRYVTEIPEAAKVDAPNYRVKRYTRFEGSQDAEKMFDWLGSGQGSIDWGNVWPLPFVKGCLVKGLPRNQGGGGHATAPLGVARGADVIGWNPSLKSELREDEYVLVVANSHDVTAQFRGFYFVTLNGLREILDHRFTEAVGFSDMETPTLRKVDWLRESVMA